MDTYLTYIIYTLCIVNKYQPFIRYTNTILHISGCICLCLGERQWIGNNNNINNKYLGDNCLTALSINCHLHSSYSMFFVAVLNKCYIIDTLPQI